MKWQDPGTETLTFSNYETFETKQSQVDPDAIIHVSTGFKCPRCKRQLSPIDHGQNRTCTCGQKVTLWGNALVCKIGD